MRQLRPPRLRSWQKFIFAMRNLRDAIPNIRGRPKGLFVKPRIKQILVAVRSIEEVSGATLGKAAALARGSGANIELFHAITDPELIQTVWRDRSGRPPDALYEAIAAKTRSRLERLVRNAAFANMKVSVHANWDSPAYEAIVRSRCAPIWSLSKRPGMAVSCNPF